MRLEPFALVWIHFDRVRFVIWLGAVRAVVLAPQVERDDAQSANMRGRDDILFALQGFVRSLGRNFITGQRCDTQPMPASLFVPRLAIEKISSHQSGSKPTQKALGFV